MKAITKKTLSLMLVLAMLISMLPSLSTMARAAEYQYIEKTKALYFTGEGDTLNGLGGYDEAEALIFFRK